MSSIEEHLPKGVTVLEASGKQGTGNRLYLVEERGKQAVLKVYHVRRSALREFFRDLSQRVFEKKTGARAASRQETEKVCLELWSLHGFDAVRVLNEPIPDWVDAPANWIEYLPDQTLRDVLADKGVADEVKLRLVAQLGQDMCERHKQARAVREPRLVHEHGNVNHFILKDGLLIAFDLENAFASNYPVIDAIGREIIDTVRSFVRIEGSADEWLAAFVAGYDDTHLLGEAVSETMRNGWKSWHDRQTRGEKSKANVADELLKLIR